MQDTDHDRRFKVAAQLAGESETERFPALIGNEAPVAGRRMGSRLGLIAVASALFMDLMDTAALATALPTLARTFNTDPLNLKFALTAYLLTVAVLVPASGWLSARVGSKRLFMAAITVFIAGSICCGLSNGIEQLVAARVLQGIGGAMMTPVGRSIVVASTPKEDLVKGMAWFTLPAIFAPLAGAPLAGFIIEQASWRWIFFINVPVGLLGLMAVARFVPNIPRYETGSFDFKGFLILGAAIMAFMLLVESRGLAGYPSILRAAATLLAIGATLCYIAHARGRAAIVDLRLLRRNSLAIGLLASWLQRLPLGAIPLLMPLLLQVAMGLPPLQASQVMIFIACGSIAARFILSYLIGWLSIRNALLLMGFATAIATSLPAFFTLTTPLYLMMMSMAIMGLARAAFFVLAQTLAYIDVKGAEVGHASVLFTVSQQLSLGMGVSLGAWLLEYSSGGRLLELAHFHLPFLALAAIGSISLAFVLALSPRAGEQMRPQAEPAG